MLTSGVGWAQDKTQFRTKKGIDFESVHSSRIAVVHYGDCSPIGSRRIQKKEQRP
jgi:hypothetical protein